MTPRGPQHQCKIEVKDGKPRMPSGKALQESWRLHNQTQMELVRRIGETDRVTTVAVQGVNADVAWRHDNQQGITIAEVKSITAKNETHQLRLAIGQVLEFAEKAHGSHSEVGKVIFVNREPTAQALIDACERIGIQLCWPGRWPTNLE